MSVIPEHFELKFNPRAADDAVVQVGSARFTVLTDRLIRLEYHPEQCFEDRASQSFWFRSQPVPEFTVRYTDDKIELDTECLRLTYIRDTDAPFTPDNLST